MNEDRNAYNKRNISGVNPNSLRSNQVMMVTVIGFGVITSTLPHGSPS
jgi:hypothetical protein